MPHFRSTHPRSEVFALAGALAVMAAFLINASPGGDLSNHYTDHLRHMAEAQALVERGFDIYRQPYGEATRGLLPCAAHEHLFAERTAPYPPLGVLLHWPVGALERTGQLSPAAAHRLMVLVWVMVALAGAALGLALLRPHGTWARVGGLLLAMPLLIGCGLNGFYDVSFLLAGLAALWALGRGRPAIAVVMLGVCAALSFRALAFAPMGLWALWLAWREHRLGALVPAALALLLVTTAAASAAALGGTLETIPADNPVYWEHVLRGKPAAVLFVLFALVAAGLLLRSRRVWTGLAVLSTAIVALLDRSHGYWHAVPFLVPPFVLAVEQRPSTATSPRVWQLMWGGVFAASILAFRYPLTAWWQWLADVIRGRVA